MKILVVGEPSACRQVDQQKNPSNRVIPAWKGANLYEQVKLHQPDLIVVVGSPVGAAIDQLMGKPIGLPICYTHIARLDDSKRGELPCKTFASN